MPSDARFIVEFLGRSRKGLACLAFSLALLGCHGGGSKDGNAGGSDPAITGQPASQTVVVGETATFTVTATGTAPLSYQWKRGANAVSGATTSAYTTPITALSDNGATFTVTVTNSVGSVTSAAATLTVDAEPTAPTITSFTANPSTIILGQVSTLSWIVANATSLSIDQGVGPVTGNSVGVSPSVNTTYTLTATNATGHVTASATVTVNGGGGTLQAPRILPISIQNAVSKSTSSDPKEHAQWTAFLARLDAGLTVVVPHQGIYQADVLEAIPDYALAYRVLKDTDKARAEKYADKAIGLIKSGLHDFQKGTWIAQQFLARGDGSTKKFTLPNADFDASTLEVTLGPVTTTPVVKGTKGGQDDTGADYSVFLKVSKTSDGAADFVKDADWRRNGDWWETLIDWSLNTLNQPAQGSTYYVTSTTPYSQPRVNNVSVDAANHSFTLSTAPTANQAVFVQYSYGTHAADYSTLAYQQTSMGDGGFNSGLIDTGYTSRYLGKDLAIGYDWLFDYPGFSPSLKSEVQIMLGKWFNYYRNHGYYYQSPSSNYGMGQYISNLMTTLALQDRATFTITDGSAANKFDGVTVIDPSTHAPMTLLADTLAHRTEDLLPILTGSITTTQKIGSLKGGFWAEGWNYGQQASRSVMLTALALEEDGLVPTATEERTWAGEVLASLIHEQPDADTLYDGGDWYAYPAPFVGKELVELLTYVCTDPVMKTYGNQILQHYPDAPSADFLNILFNDPNAVAADWTTALPAHYLAEGSGLVTARADWTYHSTWMAFQLGNTVNADHQTDSPGVFQLSRGSDQLLINGNSPNGQQYPKCYSNTVLINDNGAGETTYRFNSGYWYFYGDGSFNSAHPTELGCVLHHFEGTADHVYAAGDYHSAFYRAGSPDNPAKELTRQVVFLRPDYVVIHDRAETTHGSYPKLLRWHFAQLPTVSAPNSAAGDGSAALWTSPVAYSVTSGASKLFGLTFGTAKGSAGTLPLQISDASVFGQVAPDNMGDDQCPGGGLPCSDAALLASHTPTAARLTEQNPSNGEPVYALLLGNDFTSASAPAAVRYISIFQTAPSATAAMDACSPVYSTNGALEGSRIGTSIVLFGKDGDIPGGFTYTAGTAATALHHVIVDLVAGASYTIAVSGGSGNQTLSASSEGVLAFTTTPVNGSAQTLTLTKN